MAYIIFAYSYFDNFILFSKYILNLTNAKAPLLIDYRWYTIGTLNYVSVLCISESSYTIRVMSLRVHRILHRLCAVSD